MCTTGLLVYQTTPGCDITGGDGISAHFYLSTDELSANIVLMKYDPAAYDEGVMIR